MSFSEILGHSEIISNLKELTIKENIPSSIIFYGKEGIGKFKLAIEWAKAIVCFNRIEENQLFDTSEKKPEACEKCPSCIQASKGIHPDINVIDYNFQAVLKGEEAEKQKSLKIETIREMLKLASTKPSISSKKIFIVNDADTMTIEAQNSLLKLIEEPSQDNIIILIASNKNSLLPTILSRCQIISFRPLSEVIVEKILGNLGLENKEASYLAKISGGSVKKAIDFKKLISLVKENSTPYELSPFLITSACGKELWELREKALLLMELMTNNIYYNKFSYENSNETKKAIYFLKKISNYKNYIETNVSPKYILELALINYMKFFNINSLYKIQ